jgi:hypothetical protein
LPPLLTEQRRPLRGADVGRKPRSRQRHKTQLLLLRSNLSNK